MKAKILKARFLELCFFWATFVSNFVPAADALIFISIVVSAAPASTRLAERRLSRFISHLFLFATRPTTIFFCGICNFVFFPRFLQEFESGPGEGTQSRTQTQEF
jgi:hypothetical protein